MPPPGFTVMKGVNHAMTASNQCNDNSALRNAIAEIAIQLRDISVACHSISYELEQIRHALEAYKASESVEEPAATH
jgi:hypothetical protein